MQTRESEIRLETFLRHPGQSLIDDALFWDAWKELDEAQCVPVENWVAVQVQSLQQTERHELYCFDKYYKAVAGAYILLDEWDWNVGPCVAVLFRYTLPQYRASNAGKMMQREILRIAREYCTAKGIPWLCFTHRKSTADYRLKYYRLVPKAA